MSSIFEPNTNMEENMKAITEEALQLPPNAISYHVSKKLASIYLYPKKVLLEGKDPTFDVEAFSRAKLCSLIQKSCIQGQNTTSWDGKENELYQNIQNGYFEVRWQEKRFDLLLMKWNMGFCDGVYYWLLADTKEDADNFFSAVCQWNCQITIGNEILVFKQGYWFKDREMFESIQTVNFDKLILSGNLKQDIQKDSINFFTSHETYKYYDIPWRRGALLIGPPGNGKTHTNLM